MNLAKSNDADARTPIVLLALSKLDETVLGMVIERFLHDEVVIETADRAAMAIIDGDSASSHTALDAWRSRRDGAPTLVVSLHQRDDWAKFEVLKKPIMVDKLIEAVRLLRSRARLSSAKRTSKPETALRDASARSFQSAAAKLAAQPLAREASAANSRQPPRLAEATANRRTATPPADGQHWQRIRNIHHVSLVSQEIDLEGRDYCGVAADFPLDMLWNAAALPPELAARLFFDTDRLLLGLLRRAAQKVRSDGTTVTIRGVMGSVVVLPGDPLRVATTINELALRLLCSRPIFSETFEAGAGACPTDDDRCGDFEALLWKVAVWTARGRLPLGTELEAPFRFRSLPDFSRFAATPFAAQIGTLWTTRSLSLLETLEILRIPQRYVFSLYAAGAMLDLLVTHPETAVGASG